MNPLSKHNFFTLWYNAPRVRTQDQFSKTKIFKTKTGLHYKVFLWFSQKLLVAYFYSRSIYVNTIMLLQDRKQGSWGKKDGNSLPYIKPYLRFLLEQFCVRFWAVFVFVSHSRQPSRPQTMPAQGSDLTNMLPRFWPGFSTYFTLYPVTFSKWTSSSILASTLLALYVASQSLAPFFACFLSNSHPRLQ